MKKVIVVMSGGVDSSVTAAILKEQGYEVEGVSFILYETRMKNTFPGCCSIESVNDAAKTAALAGVRHTSVDLRDEFMSMVIEPFIEAYSKGVTPNPCILCNKHIKFPFLLKIADERGADFIATGHYARAISPEARKRGSSEEGVRTSILMKGLDPKKDQSYVLYVLGQEVLGRLLLPLGEKRKDEVRVIARELHLPAADRPESQEICFIEDKKYFRLIGNLKEGAKGPLIDIKTGKILGSHDGIYLYTMGQRKRLGIATGSPLYVVKIDYSDNAVYVGPKESAMIRGFVVGDINWIVPITDINKPGNLKGRSFRANVKVRSTMKDEPANITLISDASAGIIYDDPQWAPAPGQSAVFYDCDTVVGGGVIE